MLHKDGDSSKPLVPAAWNDIKNNCPAFESLPFEVDTTDDLEPIDSSDMNPDYWLKIARTVSDNYEKYDGFVVLHGTDTMAYTAAALSFLFENLDKPVIVTGSQLPLAEARSDAAQNLVTALMFAASFDIPVVIPEVCVFCGGKLLRGNRASKVSSVSFSGFDTPNCKPLAEVGVRIKVDAKNLREKQAEGFHINEGFDNFDNNVMFLDIFPGIKPQTLRHVFKTPDLKGVILRTYGAGNAPTDPAVLREIEDAVKNRDIVVVGVTQCTQGMVETGMYDTNEKLSQTGVISGADLTSEAALVKLMFLLGKYHNTQTVKEQMRINLRGEQSCY